MSMNTRDLAGTILPGGSTMFTGPSLAAPQPGGTSTRRPARRCLNTCQSGVRTIPLPATEELAAECNVSRSVFAERFQSTVGSPPLRYASELRMRLASQWLTRDRLPIDTVAHRSLIGNAAFGGAVDSAGAFSRTIGEQSQQVIRQVEVRAAVLLYLHATLLLRQKLVETA